MKKGLLFLLVLWACGGPDGARVGGFGAQSQNQDGGNDSAVGGFAGGVVQSGGMPVVPANDGGATGAGGTSGAAGANGGSPGTGGTSSTGGGPASGGKGGAGGSVATGGTVGTGGASVMGGKPGTGGASVTGGSSGTGGSPNTGGNSGKPNLVMNPGFESGESMWQRLGGTGAIASPGRTGNNRLDEPSSYPWWQQGISGYITGRTYRVAAWGKCGTPGGLVGLKGGLSVGGDQRQESSPFSTAWSEQSFTVTLQNNVQWVQVFLSGGGQNCSFDDVSVVEQ